MPSNVSAASLMCIPTELRLKIIETFLEPFHDILFRIYNDVYLVVSERIFSRRITNIILVNKTNYNETMDLLYARLVVTVCFPGYDAAGKKGEFAPYPTDTAFWRLVKNLKIEFGTLDGLQNAGINANLCWSDFVNSLWCE
jgi:hypothetical protein